MEHATERDRELLRLALAEARRARPGRGPQVGAVVAREGMVLAAGNNEVAWAELAALERASGEARGATLYTTLEPPAGPCVAALVAAGVARVVYGCKNPTLREGASGLAALREAGVRVLPAGMSAECFEVVEDYVCLARLGRPLVVLSWCTSLDGALTLRSGEPVRSRSHRYYLSQQQQLQRADAVLVGVGTVLAEDPALRVELEREHAQLSSEQRDPLRVVLDTHLRTPSTARVVEHSSLRPTWLAHGPGASRERRAALVRGGSASMSGIELAPTVRVGLLELPLRDGRVELRALLEHLGRAGVKRLLVAGGPRVFSALLEQGLVDRVAVCTVPVLVGDGAGARVWTRQSPTSTLADALQLRATRVESLGEDVLLEARVRRGAG